MAQKKIMCLSLGGSIISRDTGVNVEYSKKLSALIDHFRDKYKFIIVVGGGYASRLYIQSTKNIIENNSLLDQVGIAFTRINALILKDLLGNLSVYPNVITSLEELKNSLSMNDIVVLGGLLPGISTDAVSVLACEVTNSKLLINVSATSYVYDKPPSEEGAKKLKNLTHEQLVELAYKYDQREAGSHFILDLVASKLAKRSKIEIRFVDDNIENLYAAIEGREHNGTTVK
jgi:uridylate kinase